MRSAFKRQNRKHSWIGLFFVMPAVIYYILVYMVPFLQTIQLTFFLEKRGVSSFVGLSNYINVLNDEVFWKSIWNTLYLTLISAPITIVLALTIAVIMDKVPRKGIRNMLQIGSLLPMMMSMVAAALIFQWIFDPAYGIINNTLMELGLPKQGFLTSPSQVIPTLSVITIWLRVGFHATILLAGLQAIPQHYYEAARIDGSSSVQSFFFITIPLLNSQLVLVSITEIIFTTKSFEQVFITTAGGPINSSRVIILHLYETAFKWFRFEEASVIAVLMVMILILISIVQWVFMQKKVEH